MPPPKDVFAAAKPPPVIHDRQADLLQTVTDIRSQDLDAAVDALKILQDVLSNEPESAYNIIQTLVDTLVDEMTNAYSPAEQLEDPAWFRLVKHLIQTISTISANETLLRRLEYDDIYTFLDCLTLHLVQSDLMGGHFRELSKFINLILIQVLSQTDRLIIFRAMFKLLFALSVNFERDGVKDGDKAAAHADLVIKCLWKRCKVLDDDFRSGRLPVGSTLVVVEEFLSGVGPAEWRKRAVNQVALGDMPLRTIKTIIQRAVGYCKSTGVEIYDILVSEFGDDAANTIVYSYVFRLAGMQTAPAATAAGSVGSASGHGMRQASGSSLAPEDAPGESATRSAGQHAALGLGARPRSNLSLNGQRSSTPTSESAQMHAQPSASSSVIPSTSASSRAASGSRPPSAEAGPADENEAARLVRNVIRGGRGAEVRLHSPKVIHADEQHLDMLYAYMISDPAKEAEVQAAISDGLTSMPVQTYIRRALEQRGASASCTTIISDI
jgi:cytoskeleton-associated protein 5